MSADTIVMAKIVAITPPIIYAIMSLEDASPMPVLVGAGVDVVASDSEFTSSCVPPNELPYELSPAKVAVM